MTVRHRRRFTAGPEHIDVLGHVNNAVWVSWVQDVALEHWKGLAAPEYDRDFVWLVVRHEIDYRGNIDEGESVDAETWIVAPPRGATSQRRVEFRDAAGKLIVSALTTWAMVDRATHRLVRVRPEIVAPFFA